MKSMNKFSWICNQPKPKALLISFETYFKNKIKRKSAFFVVCFSLCSKRKENSMQLMVVTISLKTRDKKTSSFGLEVHSNTYEGKQKDFTLFFYFQMITAT